MGEKKCPTCGADLPVDVGERLKIFRRARGLGVRETARQVQGISVSSLSKWERGDSPNITLDHMRALAKFYKTDLETLFGTTS